MSFGVTVKKEDLMDKIVALANKYERTPDPSGEKRGFVRKSNPDDEDTSKFYRFDFRVTSGKGKNEVTKHYMASLEITGGSNPTPTIRLCEYDGSIAKVVMENPEAVMVRSRGYSYSNMIEDTRSFLRREYEKDPESFLPEQVDDINRATPLDPFLVFIHVMQSGREQSNAMMVYRQISQQVQRQS
ncbi:hypothetical protein ACFLZX_04585 [Nanoarchaeota archaeon]